MHIEKVSIQGWFPYKIKREFKLRNGINAIVGKNGAGKTTFLRAIYWMFYEIDSQYIKGAQLGKEVTVALTLRLSNRRSVTIRRMIREGGLLFFIGKTKVTREMYCLIVQALLCDYNRSRFKIEGADLNELARASPEQKIELIFNNGFSYSSIESSTISQQLIEMFHDSFDTFDVERLELDDIMTFSDDLFDNQYKIEALIKSYRQLKLMLEGLENIEVMCRRNALEPQFLSLQREVDEISESIRTLETEKSNLIVKLGMPNQDEDLPVHIFGKLSLSSRTSEETLREVLAQREMPAISLGEEELEKRTRSFLSQVVPQLIENDELPDGAPIIQTVLTHCANLQATTAEKIGILEHQIDNLSHDIGMVFSEMQTCYETNDNLNSIIENYENSVKCTRQAARSFRYQVLTTGALYRSWVRSFYPVSLAVLMLNIGPEDYYGPLVSCLKADDTVYGALHRILAEKLFYHVVSTKVVADKIKRACMCAEFEGINDFKLEFLVLEKVPSRVNIPRRHIESFNKAVQDATAKNKLYKIVERYSERIIPVECNGISDPMSSDTSSSGSDGSSDIGMSSTGNSSGHDTATNIEDGIYTLQYEVSPLINFIPHDKRLEALFRLLLGQYVVCSDYKSLQRFYAKYGTKCVIKCVTKDGTYEVNNEGTSYAFIPERILSSIEEKYHQSHYLAFLRWEELNIEDEVSQVRTRFESVRKTWDDHNEEIAELTDILGDKILQLNLLREDNRVLDNALGFMQRALLVPDEETVLRALEHKEGDDQDTASSIMLVTCNEAYEPDTTEEDEFDLIEVDYPSMRSANNSGSDDYHDHDHDGDEGEGDFVNEDLNLGFEADLLTTLDQQISQQKFLFQEKYREYVSMETKMQLYVYNAKLLAKMYNINFWEKDEHSEMWLQAQYAAERVLECPREVDIQIRIIQKIQANVLAALRFVSEDLTSTFGDGRPFNEKAYEDAVARRQTLCAFLDDSARKFRLANWRFLVDGLNARTNEQHGSGTRHQLIKKLKPNFEKVYRVLTGQPATLVFKEDCNGHITGLGVSAHLLAAAGGAKRQIESRESQGPKPVKTRLVTLGGVPSPYEMAESRPVSNQPPESVPFYDTVSYGQRRAVALALMLAMHMLERKRIYLVDEIDVHIGSEGRKRLAALLRELASETQSQYILTTHFKDICVSASLTTHIVEKSRVGTNVRKISATKAIRFTK